MLWGEGLGEVRGRSTILVRFTQQNDRKERKAKRLSRVANVTGLLLACFVVIFTLNITVFWSFQSLTKELFKGG